jgi:hypothetical protein
MRTALGIPLSISTSMHILAHENIFFFRFHPIDIFVKRVVDALEGIITPTMEGEVWKTNPRRNVRRYIILWTKI